MIFILAMGVIVVLSAMMLVFARSSRIELLASSNRLDGLKAAAIEQGAERWVLAQVDQSGTDPTTVTQIPAEALQLGDGYFWILRFYPDNDQQFDFGITDESTKVNLNTAQVADLLALPNMTEDLAEAIVDWRSDGSQPNPQGAESDYYQSLANPYICKNAPFETVGELLLVKGITPQILFGYDLNHNGVIDPAEQAAGGPGSMFSSTAQDSRGLYNYVTVYGAAPAATNNAQKSSAGAAHASAAPGGAASAGAAKGNAPAPAPSYMYSADIVAVTADGKAFKRVRIVVNGKNPPSKIIYRKDLTGLGWPLPLQVRDALRAGQPPPTGLGVSSSGISTSTQ